LIPQLDVNELEARKLEELLVEQHAIGVRNGTVFLMGVPEALRGSIEDSSPSTLARNESIRELVGEKNFALYKEYRKALGDRIALQKYRQRLDKTQHPVADSQFAKLWLMIQEERARQNIRALPQPGIEVDAVQPAETPALAEAEAEKISFINEVTRRTREFLSAEQNHALAGFLEKELTRTSWGLSWRED
jgi:hypothetical protein